VVEVAGVLVEEEVVVVMDTEGEATHRQEVEVIEEVTGAEAEVTRRIER
jgi:hypothetical protein